MVRMGVLADALKTLYNAEKRGKRQVIIRPSSKVVIKALQHMQVHGTFTDTLLFGCMDGTWIQQSWRSGLLAQLFLLEILSCLYPMQVSPEVVYNCCYSGNYVHGLHSRILSPLWRTAVLTLATP